MKYSEAVTDIFKKIEFEYRLRFYIRSHNENGWTMKGDDFEIAYMQMYQAILKYDTDISFLYDEDMKSDMHDISGRKFVSTLTEDLNVKFVYRE